MTTESFRSMFCMLKGCIGVLSSFKLDSLKGLSCISHSWFSGSDAFSSPSSLLVCFEVPTLGVFCSRYRLFGTDCVLLLFFISFSIFSSFSSIPFLKFATTLFVLSDILWVQICISFSFCVPLSRAISSSLTELKFSKLLKVSITVSLPCDVSISDMLNSLSSEVDCPRLDLLFLLLPIFVRLKCCFGEKNFN